MFIKLPSEDYINLALVNRIQIVPGEPLVVRVVWSNGQTHVFEREDAIAIQKALRWLPIVNKSLSATR